MKTDASTNPTVRRVLAALEHGDRNAWDALFEPDARLFHDGTPRSFETFSRDALGHEPCTSIERVENDGRDVIGQFHSDRSGDFRTYFKFHLSASGKISRLDIGQAPAVREG
jgi:ketosteroid isomerase-like protein